MKNLIHADICTLSDQGLDDYVSLHLTELKLEWLLAPIGSMLDFTSIIPNGISWQKISQKFSDYQSGNPVPDMLVLGVDYAKGFIDANEFNEAEAEGAVIYVIWHVWMKKALIIDPNAKSEVEHAKNTNRQIQILKVVNRIVKNKSSESFYGRFEEIIDDKFDTTTATHLAEMTRRFINDDD